MRRKLNLLLARHVRHNEMKKKRKKGRNEVPGPEARTERFMRAKQQELDQLAKLKVYEVHQKMPNARERVSLSRRHIFS